MEIKIKIKVKEIRVKKGFSIRKLAYLSSISKSQIYAIESGKSMPTLQALCQIAVALHVRPEDLYEILK